jgi:HEAT repeat protein
MIRATCIAAALAACSIQSLAQDPTPPAPEPAPAAPSIARPAKTPAPAARARTGVRKSQRWDSIDLSDLNDRLEEMKMDMPMTPMPEIDFDMPIDFDFEMPMALDFEMPPTPAIPALAPLAPMPEMDFMDAMPPVTPMVPMTPMPSVAPMIPIAPMTPIAMEPMLMAADRVGSAITHMPGMSAFERQFGGIATSPPEAWSQSDPADSLYRLARETLNRGEYRRAAQLFGDISQRFPNSAYAADARYWRAFALYRLGGTSDLRDALTTLQDDSRIYRQASLRADAPALAARIRGALAMQGDAQARAQLGVAASQPGEACDREDVAVRVEALNSLGQTDPESTTPILRRVLARKDDCSTRLRRAALWLLGRRTDPEAMNLVMSSARTDPDTHVRADALRFLAAMPGDQAIATIEEIARTPGNEELQRAAVTALGRSDSPRARQGIRAIVERSDLSENLRATALASVDAEHTSDNGAYIRSIYPRLETPRLKATAIRSLANIGGSENDQWLLSVVRNTNESSDIRATALRYAGRSSISMADLTRMYDVAGDRPLREQLIRLYAQRPEPEATDKLLTIARTGTDPDMRRMAISALSRKNDPRTKKLLLEIIDQ